MRTAADGSGAMGCRGRPSRGHSVGNASLRPGGGRGCAAHLAGDAFGSKWIPLEKITALSRSDQLARIGGSSDWLLGYVVPLLRV